MFNPLYLNNYAKREGLRHDKERKGWVDCVEEDTVEISCERGCDAEDVNEERGKNTRV